MITIGADLECDYEISDSGRLSIEVSVPSIGSTFNSESNFYSSEDGKIDNTSVAARTTVAEDVADTMNRIDKIKEDVDDPKLQQAKQKLAIAAKLNPNEGNTENVQEANERVLEAKRLLAQVREANLKEFRQADLARVVGSFEHVRRFARASEAEAFDKLTASAQRAIDNNDNDFEEYLTELKGKNSDLWWRQPWFIIEQFKRLASAPERFADKERFEELVAIGSQFLPIDISSDGKGTGFIDPEDAKRLRPVVVKMWRLQYEGRSDTKSIDDMVINVIRG